MMSLGRYCSGGGGGGGGGEKFSAGIGLIPASTVWCGCCLGV